MTTDIYNAAFITHQQVLHFRTQGYLRVRELIEDDLRLELLEYSERLQSEDGTLKSYRLFERDSALMLKLLSVESLVGRLTGLLGPNVVYLTNRHNQSALNRPGCADTRLHRDILQWSRGVLTVVVYLEDSDVDSGCTHVVPGSHLLPSVGVPQPDGGGTWMEEHEEFADMVDQAVPVPVPAGGALFFDGTLFHATGMNTSQVTRSAMVLGFRSCDELDASPDNGRQLLVAGDHLYRGNDRR
jgi:phytanoyl-CoA hydroxylase